MCDGLNALSTRKELGYQSSMRCCLARFLHVPHGVLPDKMSPFVAVLR